MKSRLLITLFSALSSTFVIAQQSPNKIYGKWQLSKFEFLRESPDRAKAEKEITGTTFTFGENEMSIGKIESGKSDHIIKSGPYHLSKDEKQLYLGNDPGDIITFNAEQLTIRTREIVYYFVRYNDKNLIVKTSNSQ